MMATRKSKEGAPLSSYNKAGPNLLSDLGDLVLLRMPFPRQSLQSVVSQQKRRDNNRIQLDFFSLTSYIATAGSSARPLLGGEIGPGRFLQVRF